MTNGFFIRYGDPDHHIRIRFHFNKAKSGAIENIVSMVLKLLSAYEKSGLIWKICLDSYKREIERYQNFITDVEDLFHVDSEAFLAFLSKENTVVQNDDLRWMFAFKSIDHLLSDFGFSLEEKLNIMIQMSSSFNQEFNIEKKDKIELDSLFRQKSKELDNIMKQKNDSPFIFIDTILRVKSYNNISIVERISASASLTKKSFEKKI